MNFTRYVAKIKALISNREADLRLCFRICKNRFSHEEARISDGSDF